jgi:hypothetical protein
MRAVSSCHASRASSSELQRVNRYPSTHDVITIVPSGRNSRSVPGAAAPSVERQIFPTKRGPGEVCAAATPAIAPTVRVTARRQGISDMSRNPGELRALRTGELGIAALAGYIWCGM